MTDLLIHNASQLVTLAGPARPRRGAELKDLAIVEGGSVLVREGLIVAAGAGSTVERLTASNTETIDATGRVVMPGFVDAHTHPVFAGTREDEFEMRALGLTYREIAERGGGIRSTVRKTRAASEEELFQAALPRVRWLLEHGTTTIEAKSGYGLSVEDEIKILRVIRRLNDETPLDLVPTFLGAHEVPDEYRSQKGEYLRLVIDEMLPKVVEEKLARFADVFCEDHVFSAVESRSVLEAAKGLGLGLRLHAEQLSLSGGAGLAAELNAATADHLEWIDDRGIDALAAAGVTAILLPGAVFNLGLERYPPARRMIDRGLALAIATDFNPGSSPTPSMQMILSIACTQMRLTPAEAITAATINPSWTLGLGERTGSLEPGKLADLVVYGAADYRQIPYLFGINHALVVIKAGRIVVDRRN
jgi:imidazolonepropionase